MQNYPPMPLKRSDADILTEIINIMRADSPLGQTWEIRSLLAREGLMMPLEPVTDTDPRD